MTIHTLQACRACGSGSLRQIIRFPQVPFTDDFVKAERFGQEFRADLGIHVCTECLTAQTQHDVEVGEYYEDYCYGVGGSPTATRFMQAAADNLAARYFPGQTGRKALDVGSGDGGQLVAFRNAGFKVLGFEPSSSLCQIAAEKGIDSVQGLFGADSIAQLPEDFRRCDVVMLSYTFDHLPNPRAFLRDARSILDPQEGLLVVEIHDLEKILERSEYCLFEHEHSIYLTQQTASDLCAREGFRIVDFNLVPMEQRRANSLLFVATPIGSRHDTGAAPIETPAEFGTLAFYEGAGARIRESIARLDAFAGSCTERSRSLGGYGAGGRGVMTLAAMSSAPQFRYLIDKKPKGTGIVAPKSGVPIKGLEALREAPVDEILVFSFGYIDEIRSELAAYGYRPEQFHSLLDVLTGEDHGLS